MSVIAVLGSIAMSTQFFAPPYKAACFVDDVGGVRTAYHFEISAKISSPDDPIVPNFLTIGRQLQQERGQALEILFSESVQADLLTSPMVLLGGNSFVDYSTMGIVTFRVPGMDEVIEARRCKYPETGITVHN